MSETSEDTLDPRITTEKETKQRISLVERTPQRLTSKESLTRQRTAKRTSYGFSLNESLTKKTFADKNTLGMSLENAPQKVALKNSSIMKNSTKILSEKSMLGDNIRKVSLVEEKPDKPAKNEPKSNSKSSERRSPVKAKDSDSSKDSAPKSKTPAAVRKSRISIYSTDSRAREKPRASSVLQRSIIHSKSGSNTSLHHKRKSQRSPEDTMILHKNTLRRAKKTVKTPIINNLEQQQKSFEQAAAHESSESLNTSEIQQEYPESEVVDEQALRSMFLNAFKDLPDINELSATTSEEVVFKMEDGDPVEREESFVAAVDSKAASPIESHGGTSEALDTEEAEGDARTHRSSSDTESTLITLDSLIESEDDNDDYLREKYGKPVEPNDLDITKSMLEIKPRNSDLTIVEIESELEARLVHEAAVDVCQRFMDSIINRTVAHCERYRNKLHRLLDKKKLMTKLTQLIGDYREETYRHGRLERLVSDYFVRKKRWACLSHYKEKDAFNETRLANALDELDRNLIVEKMTMEMRQTKTSILREQAEAARLYSDMKLYDLETLVRQTLCNREGYDHLTQLVDELLGRMEEFRSELYDIRSALLMTQHQFADMESRSLKMEDLGDGLNINEYLSTQADTETLASKIAERNGDLKRLGDRMNYDIHAMAHWKGKEQIGQSNLYFMKLNLRSQELTKQAKRKLIYQGKLRHNKIMKEINELRSSGWLMHYPALKSDYAKTRETLDKKREAIAKLRTEHERLEQRIEWIERSREVSNLAM